MSSSSSNSSAPSPSGLALALFIGSSLVVSSFLRSRRRKRSPPSSQSSSFLSSTTSESPPLSGSEYANPAIQGLLRLPSHSPLLSFLSEHDARLHVCQPSCSPFVQLLASASHTTIGNKWKLKLFQSVDEAFAALTFTHSGTNFPSSSNTLTNHTHSKSPSSQNIASNRPFSSSSPFKSSTSLADNMFGSHDSQDGRSGVTPAHLPPGLHHDENDAYNIKVPGHWQLQVPGDAPIYTNINYIIPPPPPSFPPSLPRTNPTALYTHTFVISPTWSNRRVVLRFDGVDR